MRKKSITTLVVTLAIVTGTFIATLVAGWHPGLGLDLQGGASVVLQPVGDYTNEAMNEAVDIIRRRVDAFGVAEPEIVRQGNTVVVSLPGVKDQDRALEIVGQTALLRFRPVLQYGPVSPTTPSTTTPGTTTPGSTATTSPATTSVTTSASTTASTTAAPANPGKAVPLPRQATTTPTTGTPTTAAPTTTVAGATTTTVPTTSSTTAPAVATECGKASELDKPQETVVLPECDDNNTIIAQYALGPSFLDGNGVQTAESRFDTRSGWIVALTLKPGDLGINPFNEMAAKCYSGASECPDIGAGKGQIAITLDGVVQSAPTIQAATYERDQISISGNFSKSEADDLALVLRYGALPVELKPQAVQTVSATLGKDSLRAGVIAGIIGVALVLALMLLYYRSMAVVVVLGVLVSGMAIWTVVAVMGETRGLALTLAGVTGIIVSVGVTVDSYVVYFERLKDDVRSGKSLSGGSAQRGFKSAWRTILAADLVSLIGAGILWWLTVGSVRGFAFFLGVSTLVDMVVAYYFTRPAVAVMAMSDMYKDKDKVLGVETAEALATRGAQ